MSLPGLTRQSIVLEKRLFLKIDGYAGQARMTIVPVNTSLILFVKMACPVIAVSRDFAAGVVISAVWQSSVA
ncbi:hypothetical protein IVA95_11525 [Bradyrhizobium sp. 157]|uniref:hypothetical protein n=1 Tax=Bradyrhizobium sp. 157 TaxID=2782631 RepID=UPI001FF72E41|nr:hypothetical protein [Bradyrhizobium sp. 157]MCK1638211.1 hypothetical protein [Bradyrhizobium sp. 157]